MSSSGLFHFLLLMCTGEDALVLLSTYWVWSHPRARTDQNIACGSAASEGASRSRHVTLIMTHIFVLFFQRWAVRTVFPGEGRDRDEGLTPTRHTFYN